MKHVTLLFVVAFVLVSCSLPSKTIVDVDRSPEIVRIEEIKPEFLQIEYRRDNMDRGNRSHDYFDKTIVIEPFDFKKEISRGEVLFFHDERGEETISRVVALPGERMEIIKGQIYINDKKLDTFYGTAHRLGFDKESFFETFKDNFREEFNPSDIDVEDIPKGPIFINREQWEKDFERNMDPIELSSDEYFLVSDDWWRGQMYLLKKGDMIGKVLGYSE